VSIVHILLLSIQGSSGLLLILLVLLHSPKSDGAGLMGGMASSFATQRGTESTLNAITKYTTAVFLIVSFIVGYYF
jgi:preprotein translocase subunit SecG